MSLFFETIKVQSSIIYNLANHNKRLNDTIYKNFHIKSIIDLKKFIKPPNDDTLYRCKVIYDKDIKSVDFFPYTQKVFKSFKVVFSDIRYDFKFMDRVCIDKLISSKSDDILIVDQKGYIKDTSIANIAVKIGNTWITPKNPLLKGTMRRKLLDKNILFEENICIKDLKSIESFAIMNAMIGFKIIKNPIFIF